jgi:hypothetical protein
MNMVIGVALTLIAYAIIIYPLYYLITRLGKMEDDAP